MTVPAGESSKSFPVLARVCEALIAARIERADLVVALGGGVIGDLAGLCGRRCPPRPRLRAGADDAAGAGRFLGRRQDRDRFTPRQEPDRRVPSAGPGRRRHGAARHAAAAREFRAGYAEVAKYGLIGDAAFFAWLEANWRDVFAGGPAREHAIAVSCRMKAAIVSRDERETGERALLNLGHTFGHALEAAAGFSDRLLHGEAISLGMVLAFRVLGRARAAAGDRGRARRAPSRGGRPADRYLVRSRRRARSPTA